MNLERLQNALAKAVAQGAADAEAAFVRSRDFSVHVTGGEVETLSQAETAGVGLRVFTSDRRMGFAHATDLGALDALVDAAMDNARACELDPCNVLPEEAVESEDDWSRQEFGQIPVEQKVEFAKALETETLRQDKRIRTVPRAQYGDGTAELVLVNTKGAARRFRTALCSCAVVAMGGESDDALERGSEFDYAPRFEDLRMQWTAERSALELRRRLGGAPCPGGAMPVVLANSVAADILGVAAAALKGDNVLKGKSLFADQVGQAVASDAVTIVDQNDLFEGMQPAPFDGEGASAQRTALVDQGILKAFLHNSYTACRMGAESTANAGRGGFRSVPEVSATNLFIEPGAQSEDELIAAAGDGLYVFDAMGVHTANPISGDFSFGVTGMTIENGRLGRPVRGAAIAGNTRELLRNIAGVGSDLRFFGAVGAPALLVKQLTVSGE